MPWIMLPTLVEASWKMVTSLIRVIRIRLPALNWATRLNDMKKMISETETNPKAGLRKRSRSTSGTVIEPEIRATLLIRLPSNPIAQIGTTM